MELPDSHKRALEYLLAASDAERDRVTQALSSGPLGPTLHAATERLKTALDLDPLLVQDLAHYVTSMQASMVRWDMAPAVFVSAVEESIGRAFEPHRDLAPIRAWLLATLERSALVLYAKGRALRLANDHNLESSFIVTDVRPVFMPDFNEPDVAVLVHTLRLVTSTEESKGPTEYAVAMGLSELKALQTKVERAIEKHEKITARLQKGGWLVLEEDPAR